MSKPIVVDGASATYRFADEDLNAQGRRSLFHDRREALRRVPKEQRHAYANGMRLGPFALMALSLMHQAGVLPAA